MKKDLFAELMQSMEEAAAHASGKRELRTTVVPDAPHVMSAKDIKAMREKLNASQAVFARFLNVSTQLVQAWEADRRRPSGAALRLLDVGRQYPTAVFSGLVREGEPVAYASTTVRKPRKRYTRGARPKRTKPD